MPPAAGPPVGMTGCLAGVPVLGDCIFKTTTLHSVETIRLGRDSWVPTRLSAMLVLSSQSLFRFADLGDDGLCRGGPDKGCGVIVSAIDVVVDRLD